MPWFIPQSQIIESKRRTATMKPRLTKRKFQEPAANLMHDVAERLGFKLLFVSDYGFCAIADLYSRKIYVSDCLSEVDAMLYAAHCLGSAKVFVESKDAEYDSRIHDDQYSEAGWAIVEELGLDTHISRIQWDRIV